MTGYPGETTRDSLFQVPKLTRSGLIGIQRSRFATVAFLVESIWSKFGSLFLWKGYIEKL